MEFVSFDKIEVLILIKFIHSEFHFIKFVFLISVVVIFVFVVF